MKVYLYFLISNKKYYRDYYSLTMLCILFANINYYYQLLLFMTIFSATPIITTVIILPLQTTSSPQLPLPLQTTSTLYKLKVM